MAWEHVFTPEVQEYFQPLLALLTVGGIGGLVWAARRFLGWIFATFFRLCIAAILIIVVLSAGAGLFLLLRNLVTGGQG